MRNSYYKLHVSTLCNPIQTTNCIIAIIIYFIIIIIILWANQACVC